MKKKEKLAGSILAAIVLLCGIVALTLDPTPARAGLAYGCSGGHGDACNCVSSDPTAYCTGSDTCMNGQSGVPNCTEGSWVNGNGTRECLDGLCLHIG